MMDNRTMVIDRDVYVKGNIFAEKNVHSGASVPDTIASKPGLGGFIIGFIIMWPIIVCAAFWLLTT